jgi:tetratricopeptide (TPR) repeat protein
MAEAGAEGDPMRRAAWLVVLAAVGCRASDAPTGPYTPPSAATRDTSKAEALNREAADLLATDPTKAEELLRQALTADLFFGPAHNNLGVVFLEREKLYEAAGEFEWAKKLMPGHPDPRVNLGLVMEMAGRTEEALAGYEAALEVWPGYLPAIQGLASLTLRASRRDEPRLREWLDDVALRGNPSWSSWAQGRLGLP